MGAYLLVLAAGYLLGSIPTGFLVARARGIDIRTVGSGNIGATNAFRILGKGPGSFVLLVDALKGGVACLGLPWVLLQLAAFASLLPASEQEWLRIVAGVSAVLGHNYTCWLGFKGGKGIATSAGVLGGLVPTALLIVVVLFIVVVLLTRYVSLGSILAAAALPFATWGTQGSRLMIGVTSLMSLLAIYKHRANLRRLLNGTESRIGGGRSPGGAA
ncbi:MAG TPA: acyl-phosphate glycerol 3-phosphate acyltransferase [Verrucomicrobiales bacterium]|nr:acyl-phosphate glycerol 3-phosphate acyltransferase [Verrucomicrobiales bacterium]